MQVLEALLLLVHCMMVWKIVMYFLALLISEAMLHSELTKSPSSSAKIVKCEL